MAAKNYFIYGDLPYLIDEKTNEIITHLKSESEELYIESLSNEIKISELLIILNTIPLGFFKRVVLLKNPKFMTQKLTKDEENRLLDYLRDSNLETVFLFVLYEIDKPNAIIKKIAECCESFYIKMPSSEGLKALFLHEAQKRGKKIEPSAVFYLLEKVKLLSLSEVIGEIEKASLYSDEVSISTLSLKKIAIPTVHETVFTLLDGVFEKNLSKAYGAWNELSDMGESAIKIIYQLIDNFKRLLLIQGLLEEGKKAQEIEKILNKHPYVIKKGIAQSKRLNSRALGDSLSYLLLQDMLLKSTSGIDEKHLMEDILVTLVSKLEVAL